MDRTLTFTAQDSAAWKALCEQLPGVLNVEFVSGEGAVREVHVLSDQSRSPKQLVRDIQSALLAKFQLTLDHRIVSVAQIPGLPAPVSRRPVCERLEVSGGRDGAEVRVTLRLLEQRRTGSAHADPTASGRARAVALATLEALNGFLLGCRFVLEELRRVPLGSRCALLTGLRLEYEGRTEALLGACYEGENPDFSAALAVLDGVNRRLLTLPFAPCEEREET